MVRTRRDGGCAHRRTQNSELGVPLGSAEHGRWVAGDLRGILDIDPNPNGILPLQRAHTKTLRQLLKMANDNTAELHSLFEDSPVNSDINWGELNWGPMPQWEQPLQEE